MDNMPTSVEISTIDPTRIIVNTPFVMKEHVKAVPGAKWNNTDRQWTVPLSWTACLALRAEYPDMIIGPNLREWALRVGANKKWLRSSRLNIDLNPDDAALNALVAGDEFKWLYPHQRSDALSIYMAGGNFLLMNEVGVGKTGASLAGLRLLELNNSTNPFPVLVVAPKSMLRTWEREIRKAFPDAWGEEQRSISIVDGTPSKVRKALEPGHDFYIAGWELLRRYSRLAPYGSTPTPDGANVEKELNVLGFSTIIGDECHRVSTPDSQRSRAFKYLAHRANFRIGLTGTPIQEGGVDLWHILHCIAPREYATKGSFIQRYCTPPDSKVLMSDWSLREIGDIVVGDSVIGFPKAVNEESHYRVTYEPTEVLAVHRHIAEVVRVTLEDGYSFVCTPDHLWLDASRNKDSHTIVDASYRSNGAPGRAAMNDKSKWAVCSCGFSSNPGNFSKHVRTTGHAALSGFKRVTQRMTPPRVRRNHEFSEAAVGGTVLRIFTPPRPCPLEEWERGWLAGMLDGEGTISISTRGGSPRFVIAQSKDVNLSICLEIERIFDKLGLSYGYTSKRGSNSGVYYVSGGIDGYYVAIDAVFPYSIKAQEFQFHMVRAGRRNGNKKIVNVAPSGLSEVVSLTTALGTYVVHGILSHNCNETWGDWGERIIDGLRPDHEEEFRKNFEAVTRRMTTAILPNLPPVIESIRWVDLPQKHRKAYDSMRRNLIAEIEGGTLTAQNQLVKAGRLVQLAQSYGELTVEEDGTEKFTMSDESPKLDALMDDISNGDFDGHQVVIFSESKQLLNFLADRLEKANQTFVEITGDVTGEARQAAMDAFQAGESQFCLLTRAGGEGITLTAADIMVRLVRPWSYRVDVQAAARVRRIGSEIHEHIQYIDYLVERTIDEEIVVRLNAKGNAAEEVLHDGELLAMLKRYDEE